MDKIERRHRFMKLSAGNWITIAIFSLSMFGYTLNQYNVYAATLEQVKTNKENIEKVKEDLHAELQETKNDIINRIDKTEKRMEARDIETRRDIKEILRALK